MGFIYLASPYSHPDQATRERRFRQAVECAAGLMLSGQAVFCPIAHSHPIDQTFTEIQGHDFWMCQDLPILRHADKLVVLRLDGWMNSKGIAHEISVAKAALIPVDYIDPPQEPEVVATPDLAPGTDD